MAVYMIFCQDEVTDPAGLAAYSAKAGATLGAYRPIPRVITENVQNVEGDWSPGRVVMLEFATKEDALGWYNSPEYAEVRKLRFAATKNPVGILVDAFAMPGQ
ncbi:MAG: DUF1330 domain-containing protein [Dehalococcoidia bacterium]